MQPNITISFEQVYIIEKTTTRTTLHEVYIHLPVELVPLTANVVGEVYLIQQIKGQGITKETIKNGHSRDTNNIGQTIQDEDKQSKNTQQRKLKSKR